jgi:hypothetical protein
MHALIDFARHISAIELWVYTGSSDNIAVSFDESLGFELLGASADWALSPPMDNSDIVLSVTLRIIWHNFLRDIWHNWPTAPNSIDLRHAGSVSGCKSLKARMALLPRLKRSGHRCR